MIAANITEAGELSDAAWASVQTERGELMPMVLAYFAAQDVIEKAAPTQRLARKRELQLKVRAHDAFLGKWARTAFEDDAVEAPTVAALVPGSGTYDDAQDTVGWVAMWRRHPDARAKSPVSEAYLDEAEADATELLPLIEADDSDPARRELARRAYTLWSDLYNHILRVGRFLGGDGVAWSGIAPPARPARRVTARCAQVACVEPRRKPLCDSWPLRCPSRSLRVLAPMSPSLRVIPARRRRRSGCMEVATSAIDHPPRYLNHLCHPGPMSLDAFRADYVVVATHNLQKLPKR
ncbi:MAG: hypothetical protein U1F43_22790 [Myxococcota bacterium]